jgi:hypothetical protein
MFVSGFVGAGALFIMLLAPFNMGSYSINGQAVSGPEFLRRFGILWTLAGALLLVIAYGLYRERPWTRPLMLGYWLVIGLLLFTAEIGKSGSAGSMLSAIAWASFYLFGAGAYLYGKASVVQYYRSLERASTNDSAPTAGRGA